MRSTPRKEEMYNYSFLLFLSSVLAADNNTLAHMAQEHTPTSSYELMTFLYPI